MKFLSFIRWKFVIPMLIFLAAFIVFFKFFFDPLLEKSIEYVGSQANGAKVEIDHLKTNLLKGRFEIERLQVANELAPMTNVFESGTMALELVLGDLFSKRFIINELKLAHLQFGTARKTSGAIPKKPKPADASSSLADKLLEKYKGRFELQLDGIKADLNSRIEFDPKDLLIVKQANSLKTQVEAFPSSWENKVNNLNIETRLKEIETKIKTLKETPTKGPEALIAIPQAIKKIQEVKDGLNKIKSDVENTKNDFSNSIKEFQSGIRGLSSAKQQDVNGLLSRLNLDFADPKRIVEGLIGPDVLYKFRLVAHYIEVARAYMPTQKVEDAVPPRPRLKGIDIKFPTPATPPSFWLKNSFLSGVYKGIAASGTMKHITSEPSKVGLPMMFDFKGGEGSQQLSLSVLLDHTKEIYKNSGKFYASGFPVTDFVSEGPLAQALKKGMGGVNLTVNMVEGADFSGKVQFNLSDLQFNDESLLNAVGLKNLDLSKKEDQFKKMFVDKLARAIEKTPQIAFSGDLSGTWNDPDIDIKSNLEPIMSSVVKDSLGDAINEQKKKLEEQLSKIVSEKTDELNSQLAAGQSAIDAKLKEFQTQIEAKMKEVTGLNFHSISEEKSLPKVKIPKLDGLFKK
ncbi:MAG: TIGR03545 family protein [Elusimicrobiota bacterium]